MLLPLCQAQAATPSTVTPAAAQEFMAAMQRVRQHVPDESDSPALQAYVLHDYLVAARLRRDLAANPTEELDNSIDAFVRSHSAQPVVRTLRHDWLASLADRRRWDWFLSRSTDAADPQLVCDRLAGRLATGDTTTLAPEALARWSAPQKQPDECAVVFAWLRTQGLLTPELAEARTRAALAADNPRFAREAVVDVAAPRSAPLLQWIELLEAPKGAIAMLSLNPAAAVEPDALLAGFAHLSTTDAAAASSVLPALLQRPDLTPALRNRLLRSVALGSAYSRLPDAVAAFSKLTEDPNDVPVEEWRVRAALWAGDYAKASAWLEQMPLALATQPRWRYWRARMAGATTGTIAAEPLYLEIAGLRDFYGYLAADRLKQPYNLNIRPSADDETLQTRLAAEPGLIRARALLDSDMTDDANAEWAQVFAGAKPAAQTIASLAQAGEWDDVPLRYPRPYATTVADAAKLTQVPGDWILAVMRQESLFRKDAVSRADARGLMQMLPGTATAVARRWNTAPPSSDALFDPAVAIKLGAIYLRELLDRHKGQLDLALAAYNAGPNAVARWMPGNAIDADIWIENIPYNETRGYVQHILEHIVAFAVVREAEPARLSTLLPPIEPAQAAAPAP
jgi:soluble lytic murein transglycosylase